MENSNIKYEINGIRFDLKEKHDFSWLSNLGEVFCVFDKQDSGNICFGIKGKDKKLFVKYAGAKTINYKGNVKIAIENLKQSSILYKELKCEQLIDLIETFETNVGYGVVFEWIEGRNLHEHWTFDKYPKYTHEKSAYYRYKKLPVKKRLMTINNIFEFLCKVENLGYVAIDLYDGSIMYDFKTDTTKICDIDFFRKKPTINDIGQNFWGSKRFKAPEEYILNAVIDEKTNVFNMGALIFGLLGDDKNRSYIKWEASKELYDVTLNAVNEDREKRYNSMMEFFYVWNNNVY